MPDGDILLVACYELGRPPTAVALAAALLRDAGFAPRAVDLQVAALDDEALARARLVAIAVPMHAALRLGVEVARRARRISPGARVVFFGHYAELNRAFLLRDLGDDVLAGECEEALVSVARGRGAPAAPVLRRPRYVAPDRAALPPLAGYARYVAGGAERLAGVVEASRGCKHLCRHCPIPAVYGGRFFAVPVDVVMEDARRQIEAGARHISFQDPDFLNGPAHARRVAAALHHAFPDVTWDATAKIEHLVREGAPLLTELRAHGLAFVVSAVESLDDGVLAILAKDHTRADAERAFDLCDAAGVALRPSFTPFTPWETLDGYLRILDFVTERDLVEHVDPVQYAVRLLVPPGSLLLDHVAMRPHLRALDAADFAFEWKHPDPRMDGLSGEVSALVERAVTDHAHPRDIFLRVRALACAVAGRDAMAKPARRRRPPPRLSEPWFC